MRLREKRDADICVIGGGPAGSAAAIRLAALGFRVCLLEGNRYPRPHRAASVPAGLLPLLEAIGVRERVETAGFLRSERIITCWGGTRIAAAAPHGGPGLHVDRSRFDDILLNAAQESGVRVCRPATAANVERLPKGGWRIETAGQQPSGTVTAALLVDASGTRGLRRRRRRLFPPLLALHAIWRSDGRRFDAAVEAGEHEWFWCAPLDRGQAVATVFLDPKRLGRSDEAGTVYARALSKFRLLPRSRLLGLESGVFACDASTRHAADCAQPDLIRVGDACTALDPLSSQGVVSALASALRAAPVVNTLLRRSEDGEAATAFYVQGQQAFLALHAEKLGSHYAAQAAVSPTPFWTDRSTTSAYAEPATSRPAPLDPAVPVRVCTDVKVTRVPVMDGDFICMADAVQHSGMMRSVAYVGEARLVPLLRRIQGSARPRDIVDAWADLVPRELGWNILRWLWERRLLTLP